MKKIFTILVAVLLMASVLAQSPEKMSYQAVIRDNGGKLVAEQEIGMQISILQGTVDGTVVYSEVQNPATNINGLVSIEIGGESGFETIDWTDGPYFIKTEIDPDGGIDYTIAGTSQLLSVPYALHAKTAETLTGTINETDPLFTAWDKSTGISITESQISDLGTYIETETQNLSDVLYQGDDADGNQIRNLADPTDAQDAATKVYVDESAPTTYEIGDFAQGGIVFYVEPCGTKGLVAAIEDQSTGIKWRGGAVNYSTMARGHELYAGKMNTSIIIAVHSAKDDLDDHAALVCANYRGGDFGDWYMPSKEELLLMYENLHTQDVGDFTDTWYWSSSESMPGRGWRVSFANGSDGIWDKLNEYNVRAVRTF